MARRSILAVCLIAAFAFYSIECATIPEAFESNYEINFAQNITDFLKANPGVKLQELEREERFDEASNKIQIAHRFGYHVNGDRVLATDAQRHDFGSLQDYRLQLNYPAQGTSPYTLSYLEVVVDQSSNLSRAYVLYGGIGQRQISIVVESQQIFYFAYKAAVYGY